MELAFRSRAIFKFGAQQFSVCHGMQYNYPQHNEDFYVEEDQPIIYSFVPFSLPR
jgi:hypothetical protein